MYSFKHKGRTYEAHVIRRGHGSRIFSIVEMIDGVAGCSIGRAEVPDELVNKTPKGELRFLSGWAVQSSIMRAVFPECRDLVSEAA